MLSCVDPRADRLAQARQELSAVQGLYRSLEEAFSAGTTLDGVVVASPPKCHVDQTIAALERGLPVLLEKPISTDLASAVRLEEAVRSASTPVPVLLGYTYRWWPPLVELRQRLQRGVLGPVRHARCVMSAHLADWHPWERYQDFFMASRELGGGALLDESHFLDLMLWYFGMPEALIGRVERLSSLEIETDDNVDVIARYPDGLRVTIHLDLYGRPHEKSITVVGEQGTLQCLFDPNVLRQSSEASGRWDVTTYPCERNDMFLAEARSFLELVAGGVGTRPACTVKEGVQVLQCVEAVRQSTQEGRAVELSEITPCIKVNVS